MVFLFSIVPFSAQVGRTPPKEMVALTKRKCVKRIKLDDKGEDDENLLPLHDLVQARIARPRQAWATSPSLEIGLSLFALMVLPCFVYGYFPGSTPVGFFRAIVNTWDSFLRLSVYLVGSVTFFFACLYLHIQKIFTTTTAPTKEKNGDFTLIKRQAWKIVGTPSRLSVIIVSIFASLASITSIQTVINPGWLWAPLLLFNYPVVWPSDALGAIDGICIDYQVGEKRKPLCLSELSWMTLSAGALSSKNPEDVRAVVDGIEFAKGENAGLVVNVLARDVADHVEQLEDNVKALHLLFPRLAVVIFENDSVDGSREAFKAWASKPNKGYEVDLMLCPEAEDCKLKKEHRYDGKKDVDFFTAPSVGNMHKYRQRMVDYIVAKSDYLKFSHMLQIDLDIGVSLSPLGVMHTIGKSKDTYAVASSCRQPWAGGLGTLVPPYDFNAFQPIRTKANERLLKIHEAWCGLLPPNDKWQFYCVASSVMHFLQIIQLDRAKDDLYPVESAYNGAALYPLQLIRKNKPKYDSGEFGHRCEHVGFNLSIDKQMYINRKWDCHMSPTLPGGPSGDRAMKTVKRYASIPQVAIPMFLQTFVPLVIFVFSMMTLSIHSLRPLFTTRG